MMDTLDITYRCPHCGHVSEYVPTPSIREGKYIYTCYNCGKETKPVLGEIDAVRAIAVEQITRSGARRVFKVGDKTTDGTIVDFVCNPLGHWYALTDQPSEWQLANGLKHGWSWVFELKKSDTIEVRFDRTYKIMVGGKQYNFAFHQTPAKGRIRVTVWQGKRFEVKVKLLQPNTPITKELIREIILSKFKQDETKASEKTD